MSLRIFFCLSLEWLNMQRAFVKEIAIGSGLVRMLLDNRDMDPLRNIKLSVQ